jgi:hypothetical protein
LSLVFGQLAHALVGKIDSSLQAELQKYATVYDATTDIQAYDGDGDHLRLRFTCFRFSRGDQEQNKPDGKKVVHLDLIAQVRLSPTGDRIQVRPLRLFFDKADVTSAEGSYKLAFSLKSESTWRTKNQGQQAVTFDKVILKDETPFDVKKLPDVKSATVKYYLNAITDADPAKEAKTWTTLPIIPFSDPGGPAGKPFGSSTMTMSVAENGAPPALLEKFAKAFSGSKDGLEKLLSSTADKATGVSDNGS